MDPAKGSASPPSAGPVILSVAVALTLLNVAAGYVLARTVGMRWLELPTWALAACLLVGFAATAGSVVLWRRYVGRVREYRQTAVPDSGRTRR
jgi:hypothetical protein